MSQVQRAVPGVDQRVILSTVVLALVMVAQEAQRDLLLLCLVATVGGVAWITLVSSFNVAAQEAEGPVMVQIKYCVAPARAEDFRQVMREVRRMRERDGAFGWFLARDPSDNEERGIGTAYWPF
jgi:Transmembrane secretion effector